MQINILELLLIQEEVNKVVVERLGREVSVDEFILAFTVELFEYFNAIGTWKWWKQSHELNRERILDELADCFAFFLSIVLKADNIHMSKEGTHIVEAYQDEIQEIFDVLENSQREEMIEPLKLVNNWILLMGCNHEMGDNIVTIQRFTIAIFLATQIFESITWEEITEAYKNKSQVNIDRQNGGY